MRILSTVIVTSLCLLVFTIIGCEQPKFLHEIKKSENKVTIQLDSSMVQIEIVDTAIIHVRKSSVGDSVRTLPEYVRILEAQNVSWELTEEENQVTISTDAMKVIVNSEGLIEYQTKGGKKLVAETNELTHITQDSLQQHAVSQSFDCGDEALYGLGQFQSGIMNWKNVPIRLHQYNQEIAVPFLVSTNQYGIYWNNYSITDFNIAQNEIEFATKTIAEDKEATDSPVAKTEKENVVEYATELDAEKNIRETTFTPSKTGKYSFFINGDTGGKMRGEVRLTINNDTILNYATIWVPPYYSAVKELEAGKEYKVVFQNTGSRISGKVFYNEPDYDKTVFSSQVGNAIDYYLVHGENPAEVITEYQKLTGKAPMFAKSSYGFWQCRERYHNQEEILENAQEMRNRKIPFDNIVQDWFYWPEKQKGPEWDRSKYPDPKEMIDELKSLNLKVMVSVWPELDNKRLLEKYDLTRVRSSRKIDAHDAGVRERFYQVLSDSMFQLGVNSIWLDGTEPAGKPSSDIQTAAGPNDAVYNSYSLLVTKAVYEGRRKEFPNERVFNLTRSAYAGQQRYGATSWSGDVQSTWEQFGEQIPAGLNFVMAGVPYWTHDIGGFFRDSNSLNPIYDDQYTNPEFIELLTRWFQFGTFSPIFRIHGYVSETEIWRYGKEFEETARKFIDVRYQLMPYIYSEARKVTTDGKLLMSPLAYQYPNDKNTWEIKDQAFFGESIMVGFVTEYKQRSKEIYLPVGEWYNFWTNEKILGGVERMVNTPLAGTPMFVKAGSILPVGPKVQYTTQETKEPIRIKVYPGKDATYTLYFDDNESYDYEKGAYSELVFNYSEATKELTVKTGSDKYIDFKNNPMNFIVQLVGIDNEKNVSYEGNELAVKF